MTDSGTSEPAYTIDVCPICRQQIADVDGLAPSCYHDGVAVPGVNIPVAPTVDLDEALKKPAREARALIKREKRREKLQQEEYVRQSEFRERMDRGEF